MRMILEAIAHVRLFMFSSFLVSHVILVCCCFVVVVAVVFVVAVVVVDSRGHCSRDIVDLFLLFLVSHQP